MPAPARAVAMGSRRAWVRASTANWDQERPGRWAPRNHLATAWASAPSSSNPSTTGAGPSGRVARAPAPSSTVAAVATTWGVQRWLSSRRTTEMPGTSAGRVSSRDGSAPFQP